jgi:hypothetical protein
VNSCHLAACWTSELGGLDKFIHTWVYKDVDSAPAFAQQSRKSGGQWPPQTRRPPTWRENKLLIPAAFSSAR